MIVPDIHTDTFDVLYYIDIKPRFCFYQFLFVSSIEDELENWTRKSLTTMDGNLFDHPCSLVKVMGSLVGRKLRMFG